jgi:hypothetical protein
MWLNKEGGLESEACSWFWEMRIKLHLETAIVGDPQGRLGVDERIILKRTLNKW